MQEHEAYYLLGAILGGSTALASAAAAERLPIVAGGIGLAVFITLAPLGFWVVRRMMSKS